jgi:GMP synthase (glutamine-hydrolysing)
MTKKILIIKNISHEGPGLLEPLLKERGFDYEVIDFSEGKRLPNPAAYDGFVVLGGPDSANDENEDMRSQILYVRGLLESGRPYLGICLGLQILVAAGKGEVLESEFPEVGFRDSEGEQFTIEVTEYGFKDPLFKNLGSPLKVFQLHGEAVEMGEGMALLGTGEWCVNQIVRAGRCAYGIQCHFELTPEMFEEWVQIEPRLKAMNVDELCADFEKIKEEYLRTGRTLFGNFLDMI